MMGIPPPATSKSGDSELALTAVGPGAGTEGIGTVDAGGWTVDERANSVALGSRVALAPAVGSDDAVLAHPRAASAIERIANRNLLCFTPPPCMPSSDPATPDASEYSTSDGQPLLRRRGA